MESTMKPNATIIPVKIRVVRELAKKTLQEQESYIHRDLAEAGRRYISRLEADNNTLLRRWKILPKKKIPTLESVVQGWKAEWKNDCLDSLYVNEILNRVISSWWSRLLIFSKLPESKDDEIMYLSTADAELINLCDTQ